MSIYKLGMTLICVQILRNYSRITDRVDFDQKIFEYSGKIIEVKTKQDTPFHNRNRP